MNNRVTTTTLLLDPLSDRYVYRLMDENGWPVEHWGPSVAHARHSALHYSMHLTAMDPGSYWVRAGTLIYLVE